MSLSPAGRAAAPHPGRLAFRPGFQAGHVPEEAVIFARRDGMVAMASMREAEWGRGWIDETLTGRLGWSPGAPLPVPGKRARRCPEPRRKDSQQSSERRGRGRSAQYICIHVLLAIQLLQTGQAASPDMFMILVASPPRWSSPRPPARLPFCSLALSLCPALLTRRLKRSNHITVAGPTHAHAREYRENVRRSTWNCVPFAAACTPLTMPLRFRLVQKVGQENHPLRRRLRPGPASQGPRLRGEAHPHSRSVKSASSRAARSRTLANRFSFGLSALLTSLSDMEGSSDATFRLQSLRPPKCEHAFCTNIEPIRAYGLAKAIRLESISLIRPVRVPLTPGPRWDGKNPSLHEWTDWQPVVGCEQLDGRKDGRERSREGLSVLPTGTPGTLRT